MGAVGGFVTGVLGLSVLEAVLSSSDATGRVGGAFTGAAAVLRHLSSPDVPMIPDLREKSGTTSSSTTPATPAPGAGTVGASFPRAAGAPTSRLPVLST
jgi:hypothetical protein